MNGKSLRISRELFRKLVQRLFRNRCWDFISGVVTAADVFVPVSGKPAKNGRLLHLRSFVVGFIYMGAIAGFHLTGVDVVLPGIKLKQRRMGVDLLVEQR